MPCRNQLPLLAAIFPLLPSPAAGQVADPADPLRERTGVNAAPRPLPPYPRANGAPLIPAPVIVPLIASGSVSLSDVEVSVIGAGLARSRRDWRPAADKATGLDLSHRPGQPLDGEWVRRQFFHNGLIGRPVPLDRLVSMVQLINVAFLTNGFINSGVVIVGGRPSDGGELQLRLVYGRLVDPPGGVPRLSVEFDKRPRGLNSDYVTNRMWAAHQRPLNAVEVERQFRLLAEDPAIRTINADLRPGRRPGEAALALTVVPRERFDFYLSASNSRSPSVGGERYAVGGSMRNFLGAGDILTAETGLTSGRSDVMVGYETPLDLSTNGRVRFGYNEAAVVDRPLRPLDIQAREWSGEIGLNRRIVHRPLTPTSDPNQWRSARTVSVGFGPSFRRSETSLLGSPFSFSPGSVNGVAQYVALRVFADWIERGTNQVIALSITGTQGIAGTLGDDAEVLRPDPNYRSIATQASFARRLGPAGLELRLRLAGQAADGVLYSGERIAAGGDYTVRGYRESLILADNGIIGSAELAKSFSLSGQRRRAATQTDWSAFSASVFADGAVLRNVEGGQPVPSEIASVGASLSWLPSEAISARVTFARALVDAPIVGTRDLQDRGFHFRITVRPLAL